MRPHWQDGSPAYTIKRFGLVNRYDLSAEFPILTLRKINFVAAIDEIFWIWQKKSSNVADLGSHIWDAWADEDGSIGKAYGYQLGVKHQFPEGEMDQVDMLLYSLKPVSYTHLDVYKRQAMLIATTSPPGAPSAKEISVSKAAARPCQMISKRCV